MKVYQLNNGYGKFLKLRKHCQTYKADRDARKKLFELAKLYKHRIARF